MKKFALSSLVATTTIAFANIANAAGGCTGPGCDPTPVPEISALEGTAAIAAMAAIVLLTWERRRRAH